MDDVCTDIIEGGGFVSLRKSSEQIPLEMDGVKYLSKRVSNEDLFSFLDLSTWHRRCVSIKTELVAGLGWRLERDGQVVYNSTEGVVRESSKTLDFLLSPNEAGDDLESLLVRFEYDFHSCGDSYMEIVPNMRGELAEIYHVPALGMWRSGDLSNYYQLADGREKRFPRFHLGEGFRGKGSEILHRLNYDPLSASYGMPDWFGALAEMGLHRSITEFNLALFKNAFMASMAVVVRGGKLSRTGREAIKNFISNSLTGTQNAGRVLLLESENDRTEISFERMQVEVKDFMVVDAQLYYRDAIVAASGVPPRMLGIVAAGSLGGSNETEGQMRNFQETFLRPQKRRVENLIRVLLKHFDEGYVFRLNEMEISSLKEKAQAAVLNAEADALLSDKGFNS